MPDQHHENTSIENRLRKLEELIYGKHVDDGLIQAIITMKSEATAENAKISELIDQLKMANYNIERLNNEIQEKLKTTERDIQKLNDRLNATQSLLIKVSTSSAAIGFVAGVVITILLHII